MVIEHLRLNGFFMCQGGDMGISIQSEACGEVTQHTADRFDIHAVLRGEGGEGVAEIMKPNLRNACPSISFSYYTD